MQKEGAPRKQLALVLTGGGARAAYQVGVLRYLARRWPELRIPLWTGASAGAINAVKLCNSPRPFAQAVERLASLWEEISAEQVFRTDTRSLAGMVARWGVRLLDGGRRIAPEPRALVDTAPLRRFLCRVLECDDGKLPGIAANLSQERLRAVAVTTTHYGTGQAVTWVQGREVQGWERPQRPGILTSLTLDHVMASAALPLFFPAVRLGNAWHGDGSIRLPAPLSPALHLGADRILAISPRYQRTQSEANCPNCDEYPPPAQVLGVLLNAVFLDTLESDMVQMTRDNALLEELPADKRRGLRIVRVLLIRPSRDLGKLAGQYEPQLPRAFRFLMRGLGTRATRSPDSLSMLMFQPEYIHRLLELGERDAEARGAELESFVEEGSPSVESRRST